MSANKKLRTVDENLLGLLREMGAADHRIVRRLASATASEGNEWPLRRHRPRPTVTSIEEHVRAVHREELGSLLQDACMWTLLASEESSGMVFLNEVGGVPLEPMGLADWSRDLARKRSAYQDPTGAEAQMLVLERLRHPHRGQLPTLREIAVAGMALAPSTAFEIYVARGIHMAGDAAGAGVMLEQAIERSSHPLNRAVAASTRGWIASEAGDRALATKWYAAACGHEGFSPVYAMSWLFNALQSGQVDEAEQAAIELSNLGALCEATLADFCLRTRTARMGRVWSPSGIASGTGAHLSKTDDDHVDRILQLFR